MAVRRLAPADVQPASFAFTAENLAWADATIAKYPPGKQASAIIPLLWRAQEQHDGWVPEAALRYLADMLGMQYIRVLEVATFYTMFQLAPVGKTAHVQVCGTTPCMLRGSDDIIKVCKSRIAPHQHELSADGAFSWEEVECLGACVNAPMVQIWSDCYEDLTPESFEAVLDAFARGEKPVPGPQNGRHQSVPEGGLTTLTDPGLYDGSYRVNIVTETKPAEAVVAEAPAPAAPAPAPAAKAEEKPAAPAPAPEKPAAAPAETVADEFKPEMLTGPRAGAEADDLKLIWGVGPKLEAMLHSMGVWHFDQIAAWTDMNLKWVDQNLGAFRGRAVRDKWIDQAKKLASGWRPSDKDGDRPPAE
ncbi:NADH-quinone oxidoreductase subunit NuoE [Prosthecomicrobium sp. N25]|uniref:NADH-quinone oxidoreductase subunit NuoE n=1 Tax=Prosthecomicrobium sp. N25 TaxID=3129254 RepID=UPI003076E243